MKPINRINQFLLKKYPLIWNTKLVWLLLAGLFFHLFFFGLGFSNLSNPISLQKYNVVDDFFQNGAVLLNMFISTILIVGWLFFMFKNNSFKNFYPTSSSQLFRQFVFYFIIIIFNITYYYSFFYGMKASVNLNHPSLVVDTDINITNHAAPFFSQQLSQYEINHRGYPLYFNDLYCETHVELIDFEKPHFKFLNEYYQFYTLKKIISIARYNDGYISYDQINDTTFLYIYKDTVIDVSADITTAVPSYYNFSEVFFDNIDIDQYAYSSYNSYTEPSNYRNFIYDSLTNELTKFNHTLFAKKNPSEIKKILNDFLQMAAKYKIATNLTTENWFPLIYSDSFLVKNLIRYEVPKTNDEYDLSLDWDGKSGLEDESYDENGNRIKTLKQEYLGNLRTDFYLESNELRFAFSNIQKVRKTNPFVDTIHFFMWFSFFLAALVFVFRISGLKSFIFSVLAVGILCVLLALIALVFDYFSQSDFDNIKIEYLMVLLTWIVGTVILAVPIFYLKKANKIISSIFINISLTFFAFYIFLIVAMISMTQDYFCRLQYTTAELRRAHCNNIGEDIGIYWSYILFIGAFIFLYFFAGVIRKWRALPEGK